MSSLVQTFAPVAPDAPEWVLASAVLKLLSQSEQPGHVTMNVLISTYRFLALNNAEQLADAAFATAVLAGELRAAAVSAGLAGATDYAAPASAATH